MLLREQERETVTEVIPKKVVVVEEPVEVAEVETAEEEVVEEVVEAPKKKARSIREILND